MVVDRTVVLRARSIRTLDPGRPEVECLGIRGGQVAAIGSLEEVEARLGRGAERVDLRPAVIVPGLTDAHVHLIEWSLGRTHPNLSAVGSMAEALAKVAEVVGRSPAEAWLEFRGWNPAWRGQASLAELDEAAGGRAVSLIAYDLHSGWLSSEAMRRLGIGRDREDPPGGELERDPAGHPTGVLKERALDWWYEGRPEPGDVERGRALLEAQRALHELGVTGVQSVEAPHEFRVVDRLSRSGQLRLRVLHHMPQRFIDSLLACGISSGYGNEWVRVGGIKYFTDGALGSSTAWMLEPYSDRRGRGIRRLSETELESDVVRAARGGLSATVHAIGDAAVRMTLDVLERAGSEGLAIPHRIEHLQCVHPDDLGRAARAGIVASMQPSHLLTDIPLVDTRWGDARGRWTMALRSLLEVGTVLAFGSDAPVEAPDPREGFYAAMTRRDRRGCPREGWHPEERLTGEEVLEGYTAGPARAEGTAHRRGRLSPGCDADLAAWDRDLAVAEPGDILEARVVATMVAGELVYRG